MLEIYIKRVMILNSTELDKVDIVCISAVRSFLTDSNFQESISQETNKLLMIKSVVSEEQGHTC